MSTDPSFLPPQFEAPLYSPSSSALVRQRPIPNFGHMALFLVVAGFSVLVVQLFAVGLAQGLHLFPHESLTDLAQDARLILPTMFLSYFVAAILSVLIFTAIWKMPFAEGVHWDLSPIVRQGWLLVIVGITMSILVQLLSNFLPIPKELPIDKYFKTPLDVWLIAFFGVFIAPVFEELAFRGFILPGLANTWEYLAARIRNQRDSFQTGLIRPGADGEVLVVTHEELSPIKSYAPVRDPQWSWPALIFASTTTSIGFALLHADQLAHAYAPLAVLFCVSLILCAVRIRWHSLAASAAVHACYNGTIFALLFIATSGFRHLDRLKQ